MTIHIWMHWFWITLFYKGLVVLSTPIILSPSVVEAGLQYDDTDFNLFDNNFNDYKSSLETSQIEDTYPPKKRHIEDGADLPEESSYPTSSPSAAEAAAAEEKIGTLRTNEASASDTDFRGSDLEDTYNGHGGVIDIFHHQYPVKKYSKYAELNTSKFGKSKTMPKMSDGSVPKEKNVKILKIIEEKIDIHSDKTFNVSLDNSSVSSENDTEETTDLPESITTVVMFNNSSNNNSGESHNETTSSSSTSSSTVGESNEESILSDEPIKNDQITENIVKSNKGTTKNRLNFNLTTATVTEDQNNVVQNESEIVVENKVEETVVHPTVEPFSFNNNRVAAATSSESKERLNQSGLDAGSITGITLGIVVISGLFGAISFVLYRRRYLNKPQALNDKSSNLDSSGYIDDTSFRENSEEMYSLDNDSFLNSLEAMTIQNYWTENVKHTKL